MVTTIEDWLQIASGQATMPRGFQRFIAAWELIVIWHRTRRPNATSDAALKKELEKELPALNLGNDIEWLPRIESLVKWKVIRMAGPVETDALVSVSDANDWPGVASTLYTVRCNLLKGGKQPGNPVDVALAEDAAAVAEIVARRLHRVPF